MISCIGYNKELLILFNRELLAALPSECSLYILSHGKMRKALFGIQQGEQPLFIAASNGFLSLF